jgi:hypothetical protein
MVRSDMCGCFDLNETPRKFTEHFDLMEQLSFELSMITPC